jgi:hypothetical protein
MSARFSRPACALFVVLVLASCGEKLSGTYVPARDLPGVFIYQKLEFVSGDSVDMTTFGGTVRASYKLDGKKVIVGPAGQSAVFTIDDKGCINTGTIAGTYCKR